VTIRDNFLAILAEYLSAKRRRNMTPVREIFRNLTKEISGIPVIKRNKNLITKFGIGIGNIANVPWLAILDKRVTMTTQRGIYCVYLLKANMTGFYLTFNQGVGKTAKTSPSKEMLIQLHDKAIALRKNLSWLKMQGFELGDIELNDEGKTGKAYEIATIASKYYDLRNVPTDKLLKRDLIFLLDAYEEFVKTSMRLEKDLPKIKKILPIISEETFSRQTQIKQEKARALSEEELEARIAEASEVPSVQQTIGHRFIRNMNVAELTKKRAKGKCQLCKKEAPFKDTLGDPFLEVHHIVWLSEGGKDTLSNTVALCPNCHRKVHVLRLKADIEVLHQNTPSTTVSGK
jgi:5-methylcytosine-specific restriction endonuclease McrA